MSRILMHCAQPTPCSAGRGLNVCRFHMANASPKELMYSSVRASGAASCSIMNLHGRSRGATWSGSNMFRQPRRQSSDFLSSPDLATMEILSWNAKRKSLWLDSAHYRDTRATDLFHIRGSKGVPWRLTTFHRL